MITDEHGKGLIPRPADPRDYKLLGATKVTGNFSSLSGLSPAPIKDQGSSGSCTMQAFAYYFYQLTGIDLSRQDGYSRYFLPGGGGYLTSPFYVVDKDGNYTLLQHNDPIPETEANMEVQVQLPGENRIRKYSIHYWVLTDQSIDGVAWAIDQYKGVLGGVTGSNPGWSDPVNPRPPVSGEKLWGHALYFYDHNMVNGLKNVVAESSWASVCDHHNIKENYFASGNTFDFIAMEVKELETMSNYLKVNYKGKLGWVDFSGVFPVGIFATTADTLKDLQARYNLPVIENPDGSFNPCDIVVS